MKRQELHFKDISAAYWRRIEDTLTAPPIEAFRACEGNRPQAEFDTGTVPLEDAVRLWQLARHFQPQRAVEVGTFIGTSATAITLGAPQCVLDTCDERNDCFPSSTHIRTHPKTSSTAMLAGLGGKVDLFFFDGRLNPEDLAHIYRLTHEETIYVLDDCIAIDKGVKNALMLKDGQTARPLCLIPPLPGSTLGVLVNAARMTLVP